MPAVNVPDTKLSVYVLVLENAVVLARFSAVPDANSLATVVLFVKVTEPKLSIALGAAPPKPAVNTLPELDTNVGFKSILTVSAVENELDDAPAPLRAMEEVTIETAGDAVSRTVPPPEASVLTVPETVTVVPVAKPAP